MKNLPTDKELVGLSRFLSLVLRHKPEILELQLDNQGWADIDTLIALCQKAQKTLDKAILMHLVEVNPKKRFAIDETGRKIRASQGHSIAINLGYEPQEPPEVLYHGTAQQFLTSIQKKGLLKQKRHHVHLSTNPETAIQVGQRHGLVVVLEVLAKVMHAQGHLFFCSENGVWLTDHVPAHFLVLGKPL